MVAVLPFDWQVHDTVFHRRRTCIATIGMVFPVFAA
jgi:hypothetical protein